VAGALQTGAGVLAMIVDHVRLTEGLTRISQKISK